jgi:putative transposase
MPRPQLAVTPLENGREVSIAGMPVHPFQLEHGPTKVYGYRIGQVGYVTDAKTIPEGAITILRGVEILRPNHVWSTDITYIPMKGGFLYLVAVMDWFSRFVLSWELSNTMETGFCLAALNTAFRFGQPEIWNSDQGSQFTSADFLAPLQQRGISISMDGRGRALDNVFIERLWRSLKYELIYPGDFATGVDLFPALENYFHFYNHQRPHQALGYQTPANLFRHKSKRKKSIS